MTSKLKVLSIDTVTSMIVQNFELLEKANTDFESFGAGSPESVNASHAYEVHSHKLARLMKRVYLPKQVDVSLTIPSLGDVKVSTTPEFDALTFEDKVEALTLQNLYDLTTCVNGIQRALDYAAEHDWNNKSTFFLHVKFVEADNRTPAHLTGYFLSWCDKCQTIHVRRMEDTSKRY